MPRRIDDFRRPQLAPSAADLGMEAYQANRRDTPGEDPAQPEEERGVVPEWQSPEARVTPPGQRRHGAQEIKLGKDWKID